MRSSPARHCGRSHGTTSGRLVAYRTLDARLRALGRPPANRRAWQHTLHARLTALAAINTQDRAALAGDQSAFVKSVRDSGNAFRRVAITATVFGAIRCVL
jgi:hypothetical protein